MKRYRVLSFDFDARVNTLTTQIKDEWEDHIKKMRERNLQKTQEGLIYEFGVLDYHRKEMDFIDLGPKPWSIIAFHNEFQNQIRTAFVMGAYYPALTGACALGERILNHLVLKFREQFCASRHYKQVYRRESFDNWELAIGALESWSILLPEVAELFRAFCQVRNASLHFRPEIDSDARQRALEAISYLNSIISKQFGCLGPLPWFIPDFRGEVYIRKSAESDPFVRTIYLPNCILVGYRHRLEFQNERLIVHDNDEYPEREVADEEFRELRQPSSVTQ